MSAEVIVVGGGIGGLAAAVALRRVGIRAVVYERAPEIREVGAGLSLWANAVKAMRRLGLEAEIVSRGSVLERGVTTTDKGEVLSDAPIGDWGRKAGCPSICAHRADVQTTLAAALEPGTIHLDSACVGYEQDADGVTVRFEKGATARGALLVGADGIRSAVRSQLLGPSEPRFAGYFTFRGIAHLDHPELPAGLIRFASGPGAQVGLMPCGQGRVYWFASVNGPAGKAPPEGAKKEAEARFGGYCGPVGAVIAATREEAVLRSDVIDRPPTWPWGEGRVTLLGDSIHPTTPNLGQGACMALEDAVVLADCLRRMGLRAEALRAYEQARRKRTAMVTKQSWTMGRVLQWKNGLMVWLRNRVMRSWYGRWSGTRTFEDLLLHELPALDGASAG